MMMTCLMGVAVCLSRLAARAAVAAAKRVAAMAAVETFIRGHLPLSRLVGERAVSTAAAVATAQLGGEPFASLVCPRSRARFLRARETQGSSRGQQIPATRRAWRWRDRSAPRAPPAA